ncbi:MAG: family 78 glycoside hydrolase catalytic domain [Prevotella sp.]|nr:family 78 glycoside hydrolase catalytic domain [Candidatus Prevotella equi]
MKKYFFLSLFLSLMLQVVAAVNCPTMPEWQWKGRWIGIDRLLPGESMEYKTRVNVRYIKTTQQLKGKNVEKALAYVASVGYYELFINGQVQDNGVLKPQQTDTRKTIIYNCIDITDAMRFKKDSIDLLLMLAPGRAVPMRYNKHYKCPFFGFPKVRVDVIVEYIDGTIEHFGSSEKWMATADGPLRYSNEYDGEMYDATKSLELANWQQAERAEIPIGELVPQTVPNQRQWLLSDIDNTLCVKRVKGNVFDVQQNISGWISLKMRGKQGDTIKIKYAERLNEDSTLYLDNLRDAETEDVYVCNGTDTWWHPTFTYHGFRYVEIKGISDVCEDDLIPYLVCDNMETIGSFVSSNATLNRILRNAWWGIKDNYHGFPTDCPQRNERQPWLGDRTVGSLGESYLFNNNDFYTRWMKDICDAQRNDGCIPDVAPAFWNYYSDIVTWPACLPFTCDMLYNQFGNDKAMRESYPYIKKWLEHIDEKYGKTNKWASADKYGDWCVPPEKPDMIHSKDPDRQTDGALIAMAYTIRCKQLMKRFAEVLGYSDEAKLYAEQAKNMADDFNKKYLTVHRGTSPEPGHPLYPDSVYYGNNTATANILSLAFDIVPEDCRKDVINNVVENIIVKNDGHTPCGVIGISHLLRTLTRNGYGDVAYLLATNKTYPSWGYMAENGATTIWELWNGDTADPAMNSGNHVMLLGDLVTWCYEDLAGIRTSPESMGFKHLYMKPDFTIDNLDSINCSYKSPHGIITSRWKKDLMNLHWEISLPDGVTADVVLPDGSTQFIKGNNTFDVKMPQRNKSVVSSEFVYTSWGEPLHSGKQRWPETHSASIVELKDGSLLSTYFGGTKERNPDVCIYTQRKNVIKGMNTWDEPVLAGFGNTSLFTSDNGDANTVREDEPIACWNPVLFEMPDNEIWLFFKVGPTVKEWTGWLTKSRDGGRTWSKQEALPEGFLGPIKNKPIMVGSKLICPSSTENDGWKIHFEIYDIATGTWTKSEPQNSPDIMAIQPAILIDTDSHLIALARTRPNKEQLAGKGERGCVAMCESFDGGMTWGKVMMTDVPNNQSGLDAVTLMKPIDVKLDNGKRMKNVRHVMIHNNFGTLQGTRKGPRTPLSLSVSCDGIKWLHFLTLEDSPVSQYSYPSIIQGRDGSLHCVYTWRRRGISYRKVVIGK